MKTLFNEPNLHTKSYKASVIALACVQCGCSLKGEDPDTPESDITDTLADLFHLINKLHLDRDQLVRMAAEHCDAEIAEERAAGTYVTSKT